ncbi:MAG: Rpn family recombination-promoting nuclease/putative transposase [Solobacterium sp.]|nr:Rpn family recombination-promoting nuclease/putative transposase [Solobacterium sp.]
MGQKDILEKSIMQRQEVFAEAYNIFVFAGKRIIRPEGLLAVNTVHHRDDGRYRELARDVLHKYQDPDSAFICFLGLENQESVCSLMPVRNMGYDWNLYSEQVRNSTGNMLVPVYTMVLNWTDEIWDSPLDLTDLFDRDALKQFPQLITSYPIHVKNMMFLDDEEIRLMKTELKQICMIFKCRADKEKLDILLRDPAYEHLSAEAADLIKLKLDLELRFKEEEKERGEVNMCLAWEEIKRDEYNRGVEAEKARNEAEIVQLKAENEAEKARNEAEIVQLKAENEAEKARNEAEIVQLKAENEAEIAQLREKNEAERAKYKSREKELLEEIRHLRLRLHMLQTD